MENKTRILSLELLTNESIAAYKITIKNVQNDFKVLKSLVALTGLRRILFKI